MPQSIADHYRIPSHRYHHHLAAESNHNITHAVSTDADIMTSVLFTALMICIVRIHNMQLHVKPVAHREIKLK